MTDTKIDAETLGTYLSGRLADATVTVSDLELTRGGSRDTGVFTARWTDDGRQRSRRLVIRVENADEEATSHETALSREIKDIAREYEVMETLAGGAVPIPEPYWFEGDESVLGDRFFLLEHLPGEAPSTLRRPDREMLHAAWDADGRPLPTRFVEVVAAIHDHGPEDVPALEPIDPGDVVDAELARARAAIEDIDLKPLPVMNETLRWLEANRPTVPEVTLVHGDFRIGNTLVHDDEITAVLDWELARVGDPLFDLGWASAKVFGGKYMHPLERPELACALVEREWLYDRYEERTGRRVDRDRVRYWRVLSVFLVTVGSLARATWYQNRESDDVRYVLPQYGIPSQIEDLLALVR